MFKESNNSGMCKTKFGVGSTIENRLVVMLPDGSVTTINLKTFVVHSKSIEVKDIDWFTYREFARLGQTFEPQWTDSDFQGQALGLK